MPIRMTYDREKNVLCHWGNGVLCLEDFISFFSSLRTIELRPGYRVLADYSQAEGDLSYEDIRTMAARRAAVSKDMGNIRIALVGTSNLTYGLGRMYQSLLSSPDINFMVFRDRDSAEKWLELEKP